MLTEAATATTELISVCRDHGQFPANASLGQVLASARAAFTALVTSWEPFAEQLVIAQELGSLAEQMHQLLDLVERMERDPDRSYRGELTADQAQLYSINDALRELLEHRAVLPSLEPLIASVVTAAAALHALRLVACRREDARLRWPELPALRVVGQVHLEKIAELGLTELRLLSDARFSFKRGRPGGGERRPRCAYVFENRLHVPPQADLDAGPDPLVTARAAMAAHQERAFAELPAALEIQAVTQAMARAMAQTMKESLASAGAKSRAAA